MSTQFVRPLGLASSTVTDELISAVFLIAFRESNILAIRNHRGWDLPGGHIEPGETPIITLRREVVEEAAAIFQDAEPCAIVQVPPRCDVMLVYSTKNFELLPFTAAPDRIERAVLPVELLIERYHGTKKVLRQLIAIARGS